MKGLKINYGADELAWIEKHKSLPQRKAYDLFLDKFNRQDVSFTNYRALCKRKGWKTGRTGCFSSGHVPDNKGKKMPFNANSAATQFKKGQSPHNTKHAGHENITKGGYVEISVNETNPHTGYGRRYVHKHRHIWEKENGPIPDGMCLKCLDGDKTNTALSNWELISRSMLPRLNNRWGRNYDTAQPEIKPTIMAVAKLEQKLSDRK